MSDFRDFQTDLGTMAGMNRGSKRCLNRTQGNGAFLNRRTRRKPRRTKAQSGKRHRELRRLGTAAIADEGGAKVGERGAKNKKGKSRMICYKVLVRKA